MHVLSSAADTTAPVRYEALQVLMQAIMHGLNAFLWHVPIFDDTAGRPAGRGGRSECNRPLKSDLSAFTTAEALQLYRRKSMLPRLHTNQAWAGIGG